MRLRKVFAAVLAALLLPVIPAGAAGGYETPEGFNDNDYQKMVAFLETEDEDGVKNGEKLYTDPSEYDPADPESWGVVIEGEPYGIVWEADEWGDSYEKFITQIDISGLDMVGKLDLSGCELLDRVYCIANELEGVDVSNSEISYLDIRENKVSTLDVSGCGSLALLFCGGNELTELDIGDCDSLNVLECQNNRLTSLDVSNKMNLSQLLCSGNELTSLTFGGMYFMLASVNCTDNALTSLDVSEAEPMMGNMSLICSRNPLGNNLKLNPSIMTLWCLDCGMTELDVSELTELTSLMINDNDITELDLSNNPNISILDVSGNSGLGEVDVTGLEPLQYFYCNGVGAESLDVTKNQYLTYFGCADNKLTELDLSSNTILKTLDCSGNDLTEVSPVSDQLVDLICADNPRLTAIPPLSLYPMLWNIDIRGTGIEDLALPAGLYGYSCDADKQEIDLTPFVNMPIGKISAVGDGAVGVSCVQNTSTEITAAWIYTLTASGEGFKGWYADESGTNLLSDQAEYTFTDVTSPGKIDYYAIFNLEPGVDHTHRYGPWSVTKPATCEEKGEETRTCPLDGAAETREIPATGHRSVSRVEAKDATFSTDGNIEYWRCADCGSCFLDEGLKEKVPYSQVVIPAFGTPAVPSAPERPDIEPEPQTPAFSDVAEGAWYSQAVDFVAQRGVMGGVGSGLFAPKGDVTRGMMMTIIARLDGEDTSGGETWYEKGVKWAVESGISDGLRPEQSVTRQELVTMLWRYAGQPVLGGNGLDRFSDGGDVSGYARDAMSWAIEYGIIRGSDGLLAPRRTVTRAETAAMVMRFSLIFLA